ncbi:DUF742 domain-containing protein [Streptomyces sp. NPDC020875]|uniref:DUF742 domain-containing protein n=1 Tax=Streptomyces sp. NPDC020875 TaxID=3154898 RepID=UPI0033C31D82
MNEPSPGADGRRSRPWSATAGRVVSLEDAEIRLDTQVRTLDGAAGPVPPGTRHRRVLDLCRFPRSVTELAGTLRQPLGVTAALIADLRDRALVETQIPVDLANDDVVTHALLKRVRDRLHAL